MPVIRSTRARWALMVHLTLIGSVSLAAYLGVFSLRVVTRLPFADKGLHFVLVGATAFWIARGWGDPRVRRLPVAVLVPFVIATLDESLQAFFPSRSAELLDWLANTSGILFFWLLARLGPRPRASVPT
jgi:VanZ family protein